MALQKIKSLLSNQEEIDRKSQKVNYKAEDRQYTLDEVEAILSHYDFSDIQKQKIINLFSTKLGGDQIYKNLFEEETQFNSLNLYHDLISTLTKEIFHDTKNTYINYENQEKMKTEIGDILSVEVTQNNKETNKKINSISSLFTNKEKIETPVYKGGVYFDNTLEIYEVYGGSYKNIESYWEIPKIISTDSIAKKKLINLKVTDKKWNIHLNTYVKGDRNIKNIFKKQWIKVKTVETEEEATLYLKELFTPLKDLSPKLWNLPNRLNFNYNNDSIKLIEIFISELDLEYLDIWYIDGSGKFENYYGGKIIFPVQLKNGYFVILKKNAFYASDCNNYYYLISSFK